MGWQSALSAVSTVVYVLGAWGLWNFENKNPNEASFLIHIGTVADLQVQGLLGCYYRTQGNLTLRVGQRNIL